MRRSHELLLALYELAKPYMVAAQRCASEPGRTEAAEIKAQAWAVALAEFTTTYMIPVGMIFLEYRDEYGVDISKASEIVKNVVTVEQIIELGEMLNAMGASFCFRGQNNE